MEGTFWIYPEADWRSDCPVEELAPPGHLAARRIPDLPPDRIACVGVCQPLSQGRASPP
jgi:hypothetical protein